MAMTAKDLMRLAAARRYCGTGEGRRIREEAQLSLTDLAEACGVDAATIAKWETGARRPRRQAALRYAAVLEELSGATT
jgi:DNA-binding transcriptional regulator YiaG